MATSIKRLFVLDALRGTTSATHVPQRIAATAARRSAVRSSARALSVVTSTRTSYVEQTPKTSAT